MADRYDPKVTVRPTSDRKGADPHQGAAASDDPLFELARIVSGRGAGANSGPAAPPPPLRGRPAPPPEPAKPVAPEPDILGDLEAELLSDLQASFAAVKEAIEPAEPPPAARAAPQPPAAAAPPPPSPEIAPAGPAPRPPQPEPAPQQPSSPPVHAAPPPQQSAPPRVSAAARPPIQQMPPRQPAAPAAPPPRERTHAPPPPSAAPAASAEAKVEVGNFALRPTATPQVRVTAAPSMPSAPTEKPAPAAARSSRWDRPAEPPTPQASAASRFAPPRAASHQAPPASREPAPPPSADEEDLPFGEGLPFADDGEDAADEFPLDAFDIVPGYGDDAEIPPYPDDELEPRRKRGVPRSLVVIAGILALVLIGVLGFVMLRPGASGSGTPPIISADAGPTKIAPPEPPSTSNGGEQNKLIYDRVDNGPGGGPVDSNLVTPGSEPIASVPSTNTDNPIARVILPGGPEAPASADAGNSGDGGADVAMNEGDGAQSIGPRKVRTVVVRPDGTIVSSDAVPAEGDAPASTDAVPAPPSTAEVPAVPPVATNDDTAAIAGGTAGRELAITPNPGEAGSPVETPAPPATAETQTPKPTPTPTPKPTKPKVVATGGDGGPIDLTPGSGKSTSVVASATPSGGQGGAMPLVAGGMMVQVSSQRSQDAAQATFRDLQARYPSILGGYGINVQRADLGDRGIYYRVRVGPFASTNAQSLCTELKNAGGDCILAAP